MAAWFPPLISILFVSILLAACAGDGMVQRDPEPTTVQLWHTLILDFEGPDTNEMATDNPFTDYRLLVEFASGDTAYVVRGYYGADGNAADTGADAGNIWRVKFTPDRLGDWTWRARFAKGPMLALEADWAAGETVDITQTEGGFTVTPSDKTLPDFRAAGRLVADNGYFRFGLGGLAWLKGGANSPENLLGYQEFDGTFRMLAEAREGEAATADQIHSFAPHITDWRPGDPLWREGQGKGLIGALNYLAGEGMNAVYFLTLNILGDGKDVWPYENPDDFTRFDVSKLDQWDRVFAHMQEKGLLLHIVTQETENELMLDGGDTGPQRQLYYLELIARFAHHPALVWNLGEENGPVHWRPEGQTTEQRMAMASFLKTRDPYRHPVLLHTHAEAADKDKLLTPLLGFEDLDGLSFQVAERDTIHDETRKWRALSAEAGQPWLITMDEVGIWHTGARADEDDPTHDSLRRHALWGALFGGAAGVEWYFGAHQKGNDLTTENWRSRQNLWTQTRHAMTFFETYLPYTEMVPCRAGAISPEHGYCFAKPREIYALYVFADAEFDLAVQGPLQDWQVSWHDPVGGADIADGHLVYTDSGVQIASPSHDRVVVLRRPQ